MKQAGRTNSVLWLLAALAVSAVVAFFAIPYFDVGARRGVHEYDCHANLKEIATAYEMYSTDWNGHYPESPEKLVPNYLKSLPKCPYGEEERSYRFLTEKLENDKTTPWADETFLIWCEQPWHEEQLERQAGYPQYDGIQGLMRGVKR